MALEDKMNNIYGILVSIVFVLLVIGAATVLSKHNKLSAEGSRKFIHIGVSNWWIVAMLFYTNPYYAAVVPAIFVVVNYISYKQQLFKAMERDGSKQDLGTVYYAISLLILALLTFRDSSQAYIGALGILIMGYGDGFAALVGEKLGKHKLVGKKSIEGTITMFVISFLVSLAILGIFNGNQMFLDAFILAIVAAGLEAVTPLGLDNLTVPILTALLYYVIK